jgi:hypothetical protein
MPVNTKFLLTGMYLHIPVWLYADQACRIAATDALATGFFAFL